MNRSYLLCLLLCLWWVQPVLAEPDQPADTEQKVDEKTAETPQKSDSELLKRLVPFAQQEEALKNSERWKTLSPEEQKEALDKIEYYRKLFRQRQAELRDKYQPLLEKKPTKRTNLSRRNRELLEENFEDAWGKWQSLTPSRQKELALKWKIPSTLPSKSREAVLKVWKKLLPVTRQQFFKDLR